jgi:hypothetical protein
MARQQLEAEYNTFGSSVSTHMIEGGDVESSINSIGDLQHQTNFLVKKVKKTEMSQMTYPPDEADRSIEKHCQLAELGRISTSRNGAGVDHGIDAQSKRTNWHQTRGEGSEISDAVDQG